MVNSKLKNKSMKPFPLHLGDEIRIISPSGTINSNYIEGAINILQSWGLKVSEGKYTRGKYGRFAGTVNERLADLQNAIDDPNVRAILCSRGGYGLSQLVDRLDFSDLHKHPKWIIGFSDITVLHSALGHEGIATLHGIMAKHLYDLSPVSKPVQLVNEILFGNFPSYTFSAHPKNRIGKASGKLIGGNLSVLMALRGTSFDMDYRDSILFIEDIAEQPYHIDRMMQNLRLGGVLSNVSGLVVGQFSDCIEDALMMKTVVEIIASAVADYDYPVCFNFPAGHVDYNLPIVLNTSVQIEVGAENVELCYV
jgi:muramoyltetrapeptide carboxypeptidase